MPRLLPYALQTISETPDLTPFSYMTKIDSFRFNNIHDASCSRQLLSQVVINAQHTHLQQILGDDSLAVCFELFHVPLRVDKASTEVFGSGKAQVKGCGGRERSWMATTLAFFSSPTCFFF